MKKDVLLKFINTKVGYGNPKGDFWFIGPEEGGCINANEDRIKVWNELGENECFQDMKDFHLSLCCVNENYKRDLERFFTGDKIKLQQTWNGIIEILFGLTSVDGSIEKKRIYQSTLLGSKNGNTVIGELFPFSSKKLNDENSFQYFGMSKKEYWDEYSNLRQNLLIDQINTYRPKVVVFYSTAFVDYWIQIIKTLDKKFNQLQSISDLHLSYHKSTNIVFVIIPHPVSRLLNHKKRRVGEAILNLI
jgi:hypothetical protein